MNNIKAQFVCIFILFYCNLVILKEIVNIDNFLICHLIENCGMCIKKCIVFTLFSYIRF